MPIDDDTRLRHMRKMARQALAIVKDKTIESVETDPVLSLALLKCLEIVGEAAFMTSPQTRLRVPQLPWDDIVGMRHRLVHSYYDINLAIVWATVQRDLNPLIAVIDETIGKDE